jgi:hypothetical protein
MKNRSCHVSRGAGRPRGAKGTRTIADAPLDENLRRAVWGNLRDSSVGWLHQLWLSLPERNPSSMRAMVERGVPRPSAVERTEDLARFVATKLGLECMEMLRAGNVRYFSDLAEMARRLIEGGHPSEPRAALLAYVLHELKKNPGRIFTDEELHREAPWPKGSRPTLPTVTRWRREAGISVNQGRPKKSAIS